MGRKRFKILNGALNLLRTSDNAPNPKAPSGTPLAAYQDWKSGERNISYERDTNSLPGELVNVAINPFGVDFDANNKYIVPLSLRAQNFGSINSARNAANITEEIPIEATKVIGFQPAKAIISLPNSSKDDDNAESSVTLRKYKKKGKDSYTIPMGAGSATDRVSTVRARVSAALPSGGNYEVSFKPEVI